MVTIKITASLGVAALRDNDTIETFIKRADEARYETKNGRNQIVLAK
jgi:PleD family two-component response regulator